MIKIKNSILITGISAISLLGLFCITGIKANDNRYKALAAESSTEVAEPTVNGWDEDVDNTIYCVGSVSKVYVTAAVMQLVD